MNGTELLAEFRKSRAETAFGELVRRYTNLVYSVAKRRLGNVCLAQEVTQTVFIRLARAVPVIGSDAELAAWLHRTTVHASIDQWRSEFRRRAREERALAMQTEHDPDSTWNEVSPLLDEILNQLNDGERHVILLRFFEHRSMRELGVVLGISEDAAKMRVSRAMEHLRAMFGERGVACATAALASLLVERAVEAAPAALIVTLATLQIPAAATVAPGAAIAWLLARAWTAKFIAGVAAGLAIAAIAIFWPASESRKGGNPDAGVFAANPPGPQAKLLESSTSNELGGVAAQTAPDPIKLLQALVLARNRIYSGEMEFEVATYEFDRAFEGTNRVRLIARFDGVKRRFESFGREYAYTSMAPDARETTDNRMRTEGLDQEAATEAGLLKPFESHHVVSFNGATLLDYWENDGKPVRTSIADPARGSVNYIFDPRCLAIAASPGVTDTVESCLGYDSTNSVQLLGEDTIEGSSTWHVRIWRWGGTAAADFWLEKANPIRVLRHAFNGSEVVSRYDPANPRDPLPTEVRAMILHGTTGTQTAFTQRRLVRRSARLNIPIDPSSWTLAGLGMKPGTDVADCRISRSLGYWTGSGLSEELPHKTLPMQGPPDRAELMSLLERQPESPWALQAAEWVIFNTPDGSEVDKAADVILQDHIRDTNLVSLCLGFERLRHRCSRKLLEAMLNKNASAEVRGYACFSLAELRKDEANYGLDPKATAEAERLFERVIREFGRVNRNRTPLADLARPELADLRQLTIGRPAPETRGVDFEGQPVKLSDYRGNAVLLIFWGQCGGCRPEVPPLLDLLQRFDGKPFAILGVYCDDDAAKARLIAQEAGMTWPSIFDGRSGLVSRAWHNQGWPLFDVVDAKGIIRFRNLSEVRVSDAVNKVMNQ